MRPTWVTVFVWAGVAASVAGLVVLGGEALGTLDRVVDDIAAGPSFERRPAGLPVVAERPVIVADADTIRLGVGLFVAGFAATVAAAFGHRRARHRATGGDEARDNYGK